MLPSQRTMSFGPYVSRLRSPMSAARAPNCWAAGEYLVSQLRIPNDAVLNDYDREGLALFTHQGNLAFHLQPPRLDERRVCCSADPATERTFRGVFGLESRRAALRATVLLVWPDFRRGIG
jgi:hypothetical protein